MPASARANQAVCALSINPTTNPIIAPAVPHKAAPTVTYRAGKDMSRSSSTIALIRRLSHAEPREFTSTRRGGLAHHRRSEGSAAGRSSLPHSPKLGRALA
jgi:hypothetical protein